MSRCTRDQSTSVPHALLGSCLALSLAAACASRAPQPTGAPLAEAPPSVVIARVDEPEPDEPVDDRVAVTDAITPAQELGCGPPGSPVQTRHSGGLTVGAEPAKRRFDFKGRLRSHTDGPLSASGPRVWVGPPVPSFVPLGSGTLELFVLDPIPNGYFALYRDPYGASSCKLSGSANCSFEVAAFDCSGATLFRLPLDGFFSRPDRLEVQDARMDGHVVYFNEACQSYSRGAKGKCSSLVAIDPFSASILWRTPALVSNNRFLVYPSYIVTGYGFTAEPDFLFVVRRSDGKVMLKEALPSAHSDLYDWQGTLVVELDSRNALAYRPLGFDGPSPTLERLTPLVRAKDPPDALDP